MFVIDLEQVTYDESRWAKPLCHSSRYDLAVAVVDERAYAEAMALLQGSSLIDWTDCPEVESIPGKVSGAPILKHSRMPADAILENYRSGLPAEEIAEVFQLPVEGLQRLLAYAVQNPIADKN